MIIISFCAFSKVYENKKFLETNFVIQAFNKPSLVHVVGPYRFNRFDFHWIQTKDIVCF